MYKYLHDQLPLDLYDDHYFVIRQDIHPYDTRASQDVHVRHTNTKLAENTIKTQGALVWNSLCDPLKQCPSVTIFKATLKNTSLTIIALPTNHWTRSNWNFFLSFYFFCFS